jgi:Domain of unknown function (DUF5077)/Domain of unknown function (DUF3472)
MRYPFSSFCLSAISVTPPRFAAPVLLLFLSFFGFSRVSAQRPEAQRVSIPLGGNAWGSVRPDGTRAPIDSNGITGWDDASTSYTIWFRVSRPGPIDLSFVAAVPGGSSSIGVSISGVRHVVDWRGKGMVARPAGRWQIVDTGYQAVDIRGLGKSGPVFANIRSLEVGVPGAPSVSLPGASSGGHGNPALAFVPNNEGNFFYWGRRGPSVHLNYALDSLFNAEWFYNEVTVPPSQDITGSYFMADGFNEGYFGMQVNSATERRILFSVWSPFDTDDPKAIPDSFKIVLVRKGEDVHAGAFGDEGSGGQSYLVYPWVAGNTYRFLLRAEPAPTALTSYPASARAPNSGSTPATQPAPNHTRFTAWFYAPETGHWRLIASWDRPATHVWLAHLHSFLENFEPEAGDQGRLALYGNQWAGDSAGRWIPLTRARFTVDNTARKGYRLDFAAGEQGGRFFLRNGGFFSTYTPIGSWFTRPAPRVLAPPVDVAELP